MTINAHRMTHLEEGDQSVESASGDFEQFHVEMRLKKQQREERRQKLGQSGEQMRRSGGGGGGGGGGERRRGSGNRRRRIAGVGRQTTEKGQRMRRNLWRKIAELSILQQCNGCWIENLQSFKRYDEVHSMSTWHWRVYVTSTNLRAKRGES